MKIYYSSVVGTPVFDGDKRPISEVHDVVINPESGKVLAFEVGSDKVISPFDVTKWNEELIKLDHHFALMDLEDLLQAERVKREGYYFIGCKVETEEGETIGRVFDLVFDTETMKVVSLNVAKGILLLFRYDNRMIDRKRITKVEPGKIVVNIDTSIKKALPVTGRA